MVVCGCGQARCWVVGEQARTLVGCVVVVSFHCHGLLFPVLGVVVRVCGGCLFCE